MPVTTIYVLCDPDTGEIRYVGKTVMRLCNRLAKHMEATPKTHSGRWIQVLKTQGKRPIIAYLDEAKHDWAERERFWIAHLRAIGCRLTNTSPGGDGAHAVAESTRKLLSAIHKGKPRP